MPRIAGAGASLTVADHDHRSRVEHELACCERPRACLRGIARHTPGQRRAHGRLARRSNGDRREPSRHDLRPRRVTAARAERHRAGARRHHNDAADVPVDRDEHMRLPGAAAAAAQHDRRATSSPGDADTGHEPATPDDQGGRRELSRCALPRKQRARTDGKLRRCPPIAIGLSPILAGTQPRRLTLHSGPLLLRR